MKPKKLKRAVIKEELVELTGDYKSAILLQYLMTCSEHSYSAWICKKAEELSSETMLNMSPESIRKYLKKLINKGFLSERKNTEYKWDRIMQYKVNFVKIQEELNNLGIL